MADKIQVADFKKKTVISRNMTAEESAQRAADVLAAEAEILPGKISAIKGEASRRILEMYPAWKQANMNAEATSLHEIDLSGGELTPAQEQRRTELKNAWSVIAAIRTRSNELEVSLGEMELVDIAGFNPSDPAHWA